MLAAILAIALAQSYGPCTSQAQCHINTKCNNGTCADAAGSSCANDGECGGGFCRSSKCSAAPDGSCNSNGECKGKKCVNGACQ